MGDALTDLLAVPALLRLKERADAGAEQAMVLFADIASGRMSYIDFQLRPFACVLCAWKKIFCIH